MSEALRQLGRNTAGRDYVVGDIHGCFQLLDALLQRIGFDRAQDRLFSVGDLIDRGPDSERAAEYLDKPWFHAIRGNHEQMLLDATSPVRLPLGPGRARRLWRANGGDWFARHPRAFRRAFASRIDALPYAIETEMADGRVAAIVHADVINDSWAATRYVLTSARIDRGDERLALLIWDRERAHAVHDCLSGASSPMRVAVKDVDLIVFGHTPMAAPVACANTRWLDTGAGHGNRLSVAQLAVDGEVWSLTEDAGDCVTGWTCA